MKKKSRKTVDEKIDELAMSVSRGFAETAKKADTATKDDVREITERLDKIEFNTSGLDRRVETLEDKMRVISTRLGIR